MMEASDFRQSPERYDNNEVEESEAVKADWYTLNKMKQADEY